MTDLIALAKQAGASSYTNRHYPDRTYTSFAPESLQAFADLIAAREREECECAQICDRVNNFDNPMTAIDCAAAIRARTTT